MAKLNFEKKWVLVTGASSGLGREIARCLALQEKANLIIAARRKERLQQLKTEIESTCSSKVELIHVDLSLSEDVKLLFERATEIADIYAVINNAGITSYGKSDRRDMETYEKIINVNFIAIMKLSLNFLSYFLERGEGALLNISSIAAFIPIPYQNVYAASKCAARTFTEGLYREYKIYRKKGIIVSCFAPGGIRTEMITKSGLAKRHPLDSPFNMRPEEVAAKALKAFKKKKYIAVPGMMNKATLFISRLLPRRMVSRATELIYRPPA